MSIARLAATTGETVEIEFRADPYVPGTNYISTPGGGGARSTFARDINITGVIPENRPLPEKVLVSLKSESSSREDRATLEPAGGWTYAGKLGRDIVIMSGGQGRTNSYRQAVEVTLVWAGREERLIDPMNGTPTFQVNMDMAAFAG